MITINVPAAPAIVHFINFLRDWRHSSALGSLVASPQFLGRVINEIASSRLNPLFPVFVAFRVLIGAHFFMTFVDLITIVRQSFKHLHWKN